MSKCQEKCHEVEKNVCCDAIQKAIGDYFLRASQAIDGTALNTFETPEAIGRTQLFEQFLVALNVIVRTAFDKLYKCSKSKKCSCSKSSSCCVGTAQGLTDAAVGSVILGFQASLSLGNPLVSPGAPVLSLAQVLALVTDGLNLTIALLMKNAHCC